MEACLGAHCYFNRAMAPWIPRPAGSGGSGSPCGREAEGVWEKAAFFLYCFKYSTNHPNIAEIFPFCEKKSHLQSFSVFWTMSLYPKVSQQKNAICILECVSAHEWQRYHLWLL